MMDMPTTPAMATVQMAYNQSSTNQRLSQSIPSPRGLCTISLRKGPDQSGHLVQLQLGLRCHKVANGDDLLEKETPQPGYQPFMFAAADMANGASRSAFGSIRMIRVPEAMLSINIRIESVRVSRIKSVSGHYDYKFDSLRLLLSTSSL